MQEKLITRWADLLVDYCLRVEPGKTILIGSELAGQPLVEACYRALVLRGAHPLVRLSLPGLDEFFLRHAAEDQLAHVSPIDLFEAQSADGFLWIAAESDTRSMARVDPSRQAARTRARNPISKATYEKPYVRTQYPTAAYAADAGMTLRAFEAFVAAALFLDREDPGAAWKELGRQQAGLVEYMSGVKTLRIEADGTDVTFSVGDRTWINSDGRRNMPSGEIFSAPVEDSVQGKIRCGFPVVRKGRRISGIALEVRDGRVITASAAEEEDYLLSMLDLDAGARGFGEIGIGLNEGIDRFTGRILFDEKIGGTVHLALGDSYPETGGKNESALHWDLIIDTRTNGRVTADGIVVMENGRWNVGRPRRSSRR